MLYKLITEIGSEICGYKKVYGIGLNKLDTDFNTRIEKYYKERNWEWYETEDLVIDLELLTSENILIMDEEVSDEDIKKFNNYFSSDLCLLNNRKDILVEELEELERELSFRKNELNDVESSIEKKSKELKNIEIKIGKLP